MSIWERRNASQVDELAALDRALPDRDWTVLPPGTNTFRFEAPSGSLAALSLGDPDKPRVVLVPGATGSKEDFLVLAPLLSDAGYWVQSYDLAGQYQSARAGPSPDEAWDYDLFVADLMAFLEGAPGPSHVLGYSFAGIVCGLGLLRRPDLFASLALLGVPPVPGQVFGRVRLIGPISHVVPARGIAGLLIWGLVTNQNRATPGRLQFVRSRFESTNRRSVDAIMALMKRTPDLRGPLAGAGIPRLVAVGLHDPWPVALHREFARSIGAEFREYRTGHSPNETTPYELARDLLALYAGPVVR